MAPQSVARGAPQSGDRAASGMSDRAKVLHGVPVDRCGVASSFGRKLLYRTRSYHSRRRLSRIQSRKAAAPARICSALL